MARRPSASETFARLAAQAVVEIDQPVAELPPEPPAKAEQGAPKPAKGRPKGRREVKAHITLYLNEARYDALKRLAEDTERSIHSLVIECLDTYLRKPATKAWE